MIIVSGPLPAGLSPKIQGRVPARSSRLDETKPMHLRHAPPHHHTAPMVRPARPRARHSLNIRRAEASEYNRPRILERLIEIKNVSDTMCLLATGGELFLGTLREVETKKIAASSIAHTIADEASSIEKIAALLGAYLPALSADASSPEPKQAAVDVLVAVRRISRDIGRVAEAAERVVRCTSHPTAHGMVGFAAAQEIATRLQLLRATIAALQ